MCEYGWSPFPNCRLIGGTLSCRDNTLINKPTVNSSAKAQVPSKIAGGMPHIPPLDGVGRAAAAAAGAPPPPPPPPPLHPPVPVALADMVIVG